jgi:P pilus assembly chaperone PapD
MQQVRVSLAVPNEKNLSGEYAGIVFFQTRPTRQGPGRVAFSVRIATKIYMTIPDTVKIDGAIAKMSAASSSRGELYRILFKNTGNAHVYLNNGELQVRSASGELVDRLTLPQNALVERGGSLLIQLSGKSLPQGKYQAIATVDYGGKTMTGGEIEFKKT